MISCCCDKLDLCKDFECKIDETSDGINISITGKDKKKVEALKTMIKACNELKGDNSSNCC